MKKLYITPSTAVVNTIQMLPIAASQPTIGFGEGSIGAGDVDVKGDWDIWGSDADSFED